MSDKQTTAYYEWQKAQGLDTTFHGIENDYGGRKQAQNVDAVNDYPRYHKTPASGIQK